MAIDEDRWPDPKDVLVNVAPPPPPVWRAEVAVAPAVTIVVVGSTPLDVWERAELNFHRLGATLRDLIQQGILRPEP